MQRHLIIGVALHLAATSLALAQTATGVIRGRARDTTRAVITDVQVTLVDEATDRRREQRTNDEGSFEFRTLRFGTYRIEAERGGFKKAVVEGVALEVAQTVVIDITLEVGTVNESVNVRADPALLETTDASLSQVIDEKRLVGLPLNGRNFMQLVSLSAGVINGGRASATQRQANYGPGFSVGGQRDNTSVVLVDGMEISGQEMNNYPLAIPPLDSLGEFRVQTANYPAEFGGNSGAVINVVSKRGANDFHGTLYEFLRNDALDARNPFSTTVDPLERNQFGVVASGPVVLPGLYDGKDKLFWMFSYEGTRRRQSVTTTTLVPTLEERAGDFSGSPAIIVDPFTKLPFPGNVIPADRINPIGAALAACIPPRTTRTRHATTSAIPKAFPTMTSSPCASTIRPEAETPSGAASRGAVHTIAASDRPCRRHSRDSTRNSRTTTCSWPSETSTPSLRPSSTKSRSDTCDFAASAAR